MPARALRVSLLLPLLLAAALLVACDGDVPAPVTPIGDLPTEVPPGATRGPLPGLTPTAAPTAPATPTPEPTPEGAPDEGRRTGNAGVDSVIEAIVAEDLDSLISLARVRPQPCSSSGSIGGAPDCPPDVTAGAEVEAFPVGACELSWRRDVADTMRRLMEDADGGPFAVLESPEDDIEWVSYGDYIVVFQTEPASELVPSIGLGVFVEDGRIVYLNYLCTGPAEDFLTWRDLDLDVVLPPPALEGTRTGIPAVDAVIEAAASGDTETLLGMVEYVEWPCADPEAVDGLGGPPRCDEGVPAETLVRVFPVGFCHGTFVDDVAELLPTAPVRIAGVSALERRQGEDPEPYWPDGEYIVVTEAETGFIVGSGRIVRLQQGCNSVEALLERGDLLLRLPDDRTGIAAADAIIDVVASGDAEALAALMLPQDVPCTNELGIGGPPKCWQDEDGGEPGDVPDGTVVQSFPHSTCEFEWAGDLQLLAETLVDPPRHPVAVVRFDEPPFDEEYLPSPRYGVIVVPPGTGDPVERYTAAMLMIEDDAIVFVDRMCDGTADDFLDGHPTYDDAVVILRTLAPEESRTSTATPTSTPLQ